MAAVHISEADAARGLAGIMPRVYAGEGVIIDNGTLAVAVVPSLIPSRRSASACIALARKHANESGEAPVLDSGFAADDVPVYPVTLEIARAMGRLEGELESQGFAMTFEDLAIGVTALQLGFEVATLNVKHDKPIPDLNVATI